MKIHIVGAAGAGKTTLGKTMAQRLNVPHFDSDDYFWVDTDVAFTVKRDPTLRNAIILDDLAAHNGWILSGSMVSWGKVWETMFDLVVFLRIPHEIRMQRLHDREYERYGDDLYNDPERVILYKEFMDWARGYDNNTTNGRTLAVHQQWLKKVNCPILEINGDYSNDDRIQLITEAISVNN
jgi:adenylate kinase family enzyme